MKNYKLLFITITLFVISTSLKAQFTITGEIRPRTEFRNGFKKLDDGKEVALFTEQRSRLYINYNTSQYTFHLALQDIRIWGQTDQVFKTEVSPTTFLSEGWGQYKFTPKFSIKFGRQMISYDNQRFLGGLEWAQQGRRHDALLFIYESSNSNPDAPANPLKIHLGVAYNQDNTTPEPARLFGNDYVRNNYKYMQYIWVNKEINTLKFSLLAMNDSKQYGKTEDSVSMRQTIGGVISKGFSNFVVAGESYIQMGKLGTNNVNAFMYNVNLTYKTKLTPITIGYEFLSGKKADDKDATQFDPAYGTNHAHNGYMDYFYVGNPHRNVGLQDIFIKTKFKLTDKNTVEANFHNFAAVVDVKNADGNNSDKALGNEIDLVYTYTFSPEMSINLGYSQMFATETMQLIKGGDKNKTQQWAWAMITFKPKLFEYKKEEVKVE